MKRIITTILLLCCMSLAAQDIRPVFSVTQHQKENTIPGISRQKYPGYVVKIGPGKLRLRTYGKDAIQLTYVFGSKLQLRLYSYFNYPECTITYAASIKLLLNTNIYGRKHR